MMTRREKELLAEREEWKARAEAAEKLAAMPYDGTGLCAALDEVIYQRKRAEAAEAKLAKAQEVLKKIASCEKHADGDVVDIARAALEAKP